MFKYLFVAYEYHPDLVKIVDFLSIIELFSCETIMIRFIVTTF